MSFSFSLSLQFRNLTFAFNQLFTSVNNNKAKQKKKNTTEMLSLPLQGQFNFYIISKEFISHI